MVTHWQKVIRHRGQSVTITFVANLAGNLSVYDTLFSAIQPCADNGLMIVASTATTYQTCTGSTPLAGVVPCTPSAAITYR